ncbi:hypothetical protein H7E67_17700 [Clostridium gasigenes]|uniref:hypothetical protein n=1 Tax=Clostridium gasigenes TaxID=94869 RepID=UPI00162ABF1D|nr:hypothetical protein [Clostridium gasigenes]MBB6625253.1 hypothetical protein [Clostridium gasigenes]
MILEIKKRNNKWKNQQIKINLKIFSKSYVTAYIKSKGNKYKNKKGWSGFYG